MLFLRWETTSSAENSNNSEKWPIVYFYSIVLYIFSATKTVFDPFVDIFASPHSLFYINKQIDRNEFDKKIAHNFHWTIHSHWNSAHYHTHKTTATKNQKLEPNYDRFNKPINFSVWDPYQSCRKLDKKITEEERNTA